MEQLGQIERSVLIAKRNVSEFWKKAHSTEPLFDGGFNFSIQCHRHALWILLHFTGVLQLTVRSRVLEFLTVQIQEMFKTDQNHSPLPAARFDSLSRRPTPYAVVRLLSETLAALGRSAEDRRGSRDKFSYSPGANRGTETRQRVLNCPAARLFQRFQSRFSARP